MCGGISGGLTGTTNIINCYNRATIIGNYAGGLVGDLYGGMVLSIVNSFNEGKIEGASKAGGLVGYAIAWVNPKSKIQNAFYHEKTSDAGYATNYTKKITELEMQSQDFVDTLNEFVDNYEPSEGEENITLLRWKYNEGDYPTLNY